MRILTVLSGILEPAVQDLLTIELTVPAVAERGQARDDEDRGRAIGSGCDGTPSELTAFWSW